MKRSPLGVPFEAFPVVSLTERALWSVPDGTFRIVDSQSVPSGAFLPYCRLRRAFPLERSRLYASQSVLLERSP